MSASQWDSTIMSFGLDHHDQIRWVEARTWNAIRTRAARVHAGGGNSAERTFARKQHAVAVLTDRRAARRTSRAAAEFGRLRIRRTARFAER